MPNKENRKRAARATGTLDFYKKAMLGEAGELGQGDLDDLLADIRHMVHQNENKFDFAVALERSEANFVEEAGL